MTGRELVDRVWSRLSRGEMAPLSKRGGTVEFEVPAAVEVTFLVEAPGINRWTEEWIEANF